MGETSGGNQSQLKFVSIALQPVQAVALFLLCKSNANKAREKQSKSDVTIPPSIQPPLRQQKGPSGEGDDGRGYQTDRKKNKKNNNKKIVTNGSRLAALTVGPAGGRI